MTAADFAKEHNTWIRMARSFGADTQQAKDMVQDLYEKLLKIEQRHGSLDHLCPKNQPNATWAYKVLQNQFIDIKRRIEPTSLTAEIPEFPEDNAIPEIKQQEDQIRQLWKIISDLNQDKASSYETRYFLFYIGSGKSLRQMAKENNTSIWIIQNAIKNARRKIKQSLQKFNNK